MDKILLTAFLSALAGFITAILSIVKLVNEKESKTTDYRQAWTESLRVCLASLISNLNTQASNAVHQLDMASTYVELFKRELKEVHQQDLERLKNVGESQLKEQEAAIRTLRREIYESYAKVRLHFKPGEVSFSRIEHKFEIVIRMLDDLGNLTGKEKKTERHKLREKIHSEVNDITGYAREILKTEWELVKKGEAAYETTKKWSVRGGIVMFFILISIGVHAAFSAFKHDAKDTKVSLSMVAPENSPSMVPLNPVIASGTPEALAQPGGGVHTQVVYIDGGARRQENRIAEPRIVKPTINGDASSGKCLPTNYCNSTVEK